MIIVYIFFISLALVLEGLFSGSETALISSNLMRLIHLKEKGRKRARVAYELLMRPDRLLATTLVGTNLSVVLSSSLATFLFVHLLKNENKASFFATLVITPIVLVVGEIIPKILGRQYANKIVLYVAFPLIFFQKLFAPAVGFLSFIARLIMRLLQVKGPEKNPFITQDEIKLLIAQIAKEGVLEKQEESALQKIFEFTLTKAGDIMTPMNKVASLDYLDTVEQIKEKSRNYGFTRFPVFKDKQLVGLIHVFDIFYTQDNTAWTELIRPIRQVDVNLRIDELFSHMKANKEALAAVVDGNKFLGTVTIEDIMEEVICRVCE